MWLEATAFFEQLEVGAKRVVLISAEGLPGPSDAITNIHDPGPPVQVRDVINRDHPFGRALQPAQEHREPDQQQADYCQSDPRPQAHWRGRIGGGCGKVGRDGG